MSISDYEVFKNYGTGNPYQSQASMQAYQQALIDQQTRYLEQAIRAGLPDPNPQDNRKQKLLLLETAL